MHVKALLAQVVAALLEALLDRDADALDRGAGVLADLDQARHGAAVGHEVVDDEHVVVLADELLGDDDVERAPVREALDAGAIHGAVEVDALALLREHHGGAEDLADDRGDADAGGLDGEDLVDGLVGEVALPFARHLDEELDVHLMVEERVDLQHVAVLHHAVLADAILQKLHRGTFPLVARPSSCDRVKIS